MSGELPLVPPARLGGLLTEQRTRRGLTIEELHARADPGFSSDELRRIEQGGLALDDAQITRLLDVYGASAGTIIPERSALVVDLDGRALVAGHRTKVLPTGAGIDDVLGRYLALLYLLRDLEPGRRLALRGHDLDVLAAALERSVAEVEQRLFVLMGPGQPLPWHTRLRHRLAVPAAGLLVGLTSVGALILIPIPKGQRPTLSAGTAAGFSSPPSVASGVELGSAAVVTRGDAQPADGPAAIGLAAERLLGFDIRGQLPDWTIVYEGPRSGYLGHTNTLTRTITVHVSSIDTPSIVAGVLAHEIGHALDVMYLDAEGRRQWLAARGLDVGWWPESGASDFHLGAGDFAEAVAVLIARSPSDSAYGSFTEAQLELVARLVPLDAAPAS